MAMITTWSTLSHMTSSGRSPKVTQTRWVSDPKTLPRLGNQFYNCTLDAFPEPAFYALTVNLSLNWRVQACRGFPLSSLYPNQILTYQPLMTSIWVSNCFQPSALTTLRYIDTLEMKAKLTKLECPSSWLAQPPWKPWELNILVESSAIVP